MEMHSRASKVLLIKANAFSRARATTPREYFDHIVVSEIPFFFFSPCLFTARNGERLIGCVWMRIRDDGGRRSTSRVASYAWTITVETCSRFSWNTSAGRARANCNRVTSYRRIRCAREFASANKTNSLYWAAFNIDFLVCASSRKQHG